MKIKPPTVSTESIQSAWKGIASGSECPRPFADRSTNQNVPKTSAISLDPLTNLCPISPLNALRSSKADEAVPPAGRRVAPHLQQSEVAASSKRTREVVKPNVPDEADAETTVLKRPRLPVTSNEVSNGRADGDGIRLTRVPASVADKAKSHGLEVIASIVDQHREQYISLEVKNEALMSEVGELKKALKARDAYATALKEKAKSLVARAQTAMQGALDVKELWTDHRARMQELLKTCSVKVVDVEGMREQFAKLTRNEVAEALQTIASLRGEAKDIRGLYQTSEEKSKEVLRVQREYLEQIKFDHAEHAAKVKETDAEVKKLTTEKHLLVNELVQKDSDITHLREARDSLEATIVEKESDSQKTREQVLQLKKELEQTHEEKLSLQKRLASTGAQLHGAQNNLCAHEKKVQETLKKLAELEIKVDALTSAHEADLTQLSEAQSHIQELETARDDALRAGESLRAANDDIQERFEALARSSDEHRNKCATLLASNEALEEKLQSANKSYSELEYLPTALSEAQCEIKLYGSRLQSALEDHRLLQERFYALQKKLSQTEAEKALQVEQSYTLRKDLAEKEDQSIEAQESHSKALQDTKQAWQKESASLKLDLEIHRVQHAHEVQSLEQRIEDMQQSMTEKQSLLRAAETGRVAAETHLERVTAELATISRTANGESDICAGLKAELANARNAKADAKEKMAELQERCDVQNTGMSQLKDQAVILQTKIVHMEGVLRQTEEKASARQAEYDKRVMTLEQEINRLREQLVQAEQDAELGSTVDGGVMERFKSGNLTASEGALVREISDANHREMTRLANELKKAQAEFRKADAQNKTLLKKINAQQHIDAKGVNEGPIRHATSTKRQILLPSSDEQSVSSNFEHILDQERDAEPASIVATSMTLSRGGQRSLMKRMTRGVRPEHTGHSAPIAKSRGTDAAQTDSNAFSEVEPDNAVTVGPSVRRTARRS
ncbi:hypothetical protein K437DRAFT_266948 [Tilletiaria anomala UBC 951]|uniref:Uncharacterized protein n=1 Tax=Tilletiaria anomala (strain ATCC 24038 / CBS 436.72 / UBC 951) TaxID=1037660 RepID=A0A066WHT0_TILAU|nr:uncharacterized protein K437DRAFT_266948 [Tilletiaria anomala UBC 951]KDN52088.1 hypothetical protein K437DRAFT_266948 [Tilletiaria anomala UBC 951]